MFHPSNILARLTKIFPGAVGRIIFEIFNEQVNWPNTFSQAAPTVASSAGVLAITTPVTFVSGVAAITGISAPSNLLNAQAGSSGYGARIWLIPTGIFTWTAAGNIALAGTAVVGKALELTYDSVANKWYPSYIA